MSFVKNECQQLTLEDSMFSLTARERRMLEKSWAKPFAEKIFPLINEENFSVLYSDKASRPNTPVNVIVGGMVLEELMGLTDEEFMDSLMVASNIRKLGRMELLYTCVADLVSFLHRTGMDDLLGGMEHYYDPNDYNRVIYHSKSEDASDRIKQILADADKLLAECEGACDESSAYQLLVRVLKEQTVVEGAGARRLKTKEDGSMGSQILQNPSDSDATYREKAGKQNRGYTANVVETVGDNGSIVTDYQYEKTHIVTASS